MAPTTQRSAPSSSAPQKQANGIGEQDTSTATTGDVSVNRKKQKRRQKQAARLAAEHTSKVTLEESQGHNGHRGSSHSAFATHGANGTELNSSEDHYEPREGEELYYSDEEGHYIDNGQGNLPNGKGKKKKGKHHSHAESQHGYHSTYPTHRMPPSTGSRFNAPPPPPPPPPLNTSTVREHKVTSDRIWNTSTAEERERIKEFWLSLEETERRSLVKVEKEAVLKKMKEQQKHSCSCSVCGRKRTAIEEELEVLYDAYYEELEQYANHQQISLDDGTPIMAPPSTYPPLRGLPPRLVPPLMNAQRPDRAKIEEILEDDEDGEEEDYSDEDEDEEDYSEEDLEPERRDRAADFFNFGNSLTVQGGILTVADDLLKNDGKKFIEMMEQLAERRMQREEEASFAAAGLRHPSMQGHNHGPPMDDEEYDDEDDEDYDSQDDEDYDEDEMETMTEEQRMEEGRRMFQIFAARMFEQRVLTAYREKVARERQEKLLEELADESRQDAEREAKKAKEAQKKKDKKRQQKHAKDEEKAKREADKAAEEAAVKAIEEQKLEEQRQKKEEQRKKREAEKKALDEERQRKEAEKQKKLQEVREQQVELEKTQREQKEREKKRREDVKKKEREEREAKELEAKQRKEREAVEKRQRDVKAKTEKEAQARARKEDQAVKQPAQPVPVPVPTILRKPSTAVPLPIGLQANPSNHASPHLHVATPVIPKASSPAKPRQTSFQSSHQSSPKSAKMPTGSSATSPSMSNPQHQTTLPAAPMTTKAPNSFAPMQPPQLTPAIQPLAPPPGMHPQHHGGGMVSPGMIGGGFPVNYSPMMSGMIQRVPPGHEASMYAHQQAFNQSQFRNFIAPNGLPYPPGINGIRHIAQGRGNPNDGIPTQVPPRHGHIPSTPTGNSQYGVTHTMPSHSHSRNTSASFEKNNLDLGTTTSAHPIARPAPIQRPSSVPYHDETRFGSSEIDDLNRHLGSSALLEDSDDALIPNTDDARDSMAPGAHRPSRLGFAQSPMFPDPIGSAKMENFPRGNQSGNTWGAPQMPFGTPSLPNTAPWSAAPSSGWGHNNTFGVIGGPNRHPSRPVAVRLLVCQACRQLTINNPTKSGNGFHSVELLMRQVDQLKSPHEGPIQPRELLEICETEGNVQNGGGTFMVLEDPNRGILVKFEPDNNGPGMGRGIGAPGQIGSPMAGHALPAFGVARGFQQSGAGLPTHPGF